VGNMDQVVLKAMAVKNLAAGARHQGAWFLRRQPLAAASLDAPVESIAPDEIVD
jgi:hypothetical protein